MRKLFKFNNNICDQILNEANIHFTKVCPNKCPFCIDALNQGITYNRPNVDKIFISVLSIIDKIDEITISGGEPFVYIDDLLQLVKNIKRYVKKKITVITSLPKQCYDNKETFFEIIKYIDCLIISPQHMDMKIGDKIRGHKTTFDRESLLKEIPYKSKVSLTINIIKGYLDTLDDIRNNIRYFESLGFSHFKLAEIFDHDELYVSIEKILGIKMKQPFSLGCSEKHFDMSPFIGETSSDFTIKRICFYRTKHVHASLTDLIKILLRPFFAKKSFFCVIYENGEILPRWV